MDAALFLTNDELDSAFQTKEFAPLFQPTVSLERLRGISAETSLQWHHPALGVIEDTIFVPFIEAQGRRRELTLFLLRAAIRACADWHREGLDWSASVRIAPSEFLEGDLVASIGLMAHEFHLNPANLTIEIREGEIAGLVSQLLPVLTELRTLGCGLALRTGAALTVPQEIRNLPLTNLTITGGATLQFIQRTRQAQYGLFAQRLAEAQARNMCVTAAGVEDEATLWAIQRAGFTAAKGTYICRPLPPKGLARWNMIWQQAAETIAASKRAQNIVAASEPAVERAAPEPLSPAPQELYAAPSTQASARPELAADEPITVFAASTESYPEAPPPAFLHRQTSPVEVEFEAVDIDPAGEEDDLSASADIIEVASPEPIVEPAYEPSAEPNLETQLEALVEASDEGIEAEPDFVEVVDPSAPEVTDTFSPEEMSEGSGGEPAALDPEPNAEAVEDSETSEPEASVPEPTSRIDLSHWISTRSQSVELPHNPLDDYFEGIEPSAPAPTAPPADTYAAYEEMVPYSEDVAASAPEAPAAEAPIVVDVAIEANEPPLVVEAPVVEVATEAGTEPEEVVDEELPIRVRPERLLEPKPATTIRSPASEDPNAPPPLIARTIRGVDRPITMQVQNPGREGISLKNLFKKRSGK